jgi:hypothetical protein
VNSEEQIAHFTRDLHNLIERYHDEYDISFQSMIGVLELQKAILVEECLGFSFEVDDDGEDMSNPA